MRRFDLTRVYCSPNNTYDVLFNGESHNLGNFLEDFTPAVNPPAEIDDPEDTKPEDWVDTKRIADPDAKKVGLRISMIIGCLVLNRVSCL